MAKLIRLKFGKYGFRLAGSVISKSLLHHLHNIEGGPKKQHKVYGTIILQPYVTESCGFQQNVSKEILYVTKVIV